ncbi:MAG: 2-succinyl-5-enolpyruvyl-6-hydroxy-3-cyclohexene-1-carboxylic-acid synthase [Cyclobacteriaceae bacterium]
MILQALHDISELCALKGIEYALLSPGSRCAPLTISFARNPAINKFTFSDERSAAFHAVGIAGETGKPVVLVCTSGSAAYNYAPAVAEAFYQHIPLIIFTADRPGEWVGQQDGQTIQQRDIYGNHVKKSYELPGDYVSEDADWFVNRIVNEAVNLSETHPKGPVHINVPLREPFYPEPDESLQFSENIRVIKTYSAASGVEMEFYSKKLADYSKVLVVPGQSLHDTELIEALSKFREKTRCTIISDIIANQHQTDDVIRHHDLFIDHAKGLPESFMPELLITFGNSLISKNLKLYLRSCQPKEHWHIQPYTTPLADTLKNTTELILTHPKSFLQQISLDSVISDDFNLQKKQNYQHAWSIIDNKVGAYLDKELQKDQFNELTAVGNCMTFLPDQSVLHLANSMAVRYANFIGLKGKKGISVKANRGTSGIDGSNSTAFGNALVTDKIVTLITGDLAFFYDRNAFWNNYKAANLRIILLNNFGGGIFRMIKGPAHLNELEEFFVTKQQQTATHLAAEYGFQYSIVNNKSELNRNLPLFFRRSDSPKILEIRTDSKQSASYLKSLKKIVSD